MPSPQVPPHRFPRRTSNSNIQQNAAQHAARSFSDSAPSGLSRTLPSQTSSPKPLRQYKAKISKKPNQKKSGYAPLAEDHADFLMSDVSPVASGSSNGLDYFGTPANPNDSDSDQDAPERRGRSMSSAHSQDRLFNFGGKKPKRAHSSALPSTSRDRSRNGEYEHQEPLVSYAPSIMPGLDEEPSHGDGGSAYSDSLVTPALEFANSVTAVTPLSSADFLAIIDEVRAAIAEGVYPTLISQGSSGSYFCRNRAGEMLGVFKPKNEEPYGHLNPKWTKWIHKNMFPCCFGRSCIIPNLGYISEAAASYIDRRLQLHVVPRTEVVYLASPTFYYSRKDWKSYTRGGELPEKVGSFQVFLKGYKDATTFFREGYESMRRSGSASMPSSQRPSSENLPRQMQTPDPQNPYQWSERARREFRWGFERLAILDYLIRNTDRGLDNWMVKYDAALDAVEREADDGAASEALKKPAHVSIEMPPPPTATSVSPEVTLADTMFDTGSPESGAEGLNECEADSEISPLAPGRRTSVPDQATTASPVSSAGTIPVSVASNADISEPSPADGVKPVIQVAAIDNGLAFPYKHPDRWRSYPYGWSFLPASRIPFSPETRVHILHLLTSPTWWRETMDGLERLFRIDADFSERMWKKQRAVVRGEGYNLVECLRRSETGSVGGSPWGLVRRPVVSVFEDEDEGEDEDEALDGIVGGPALGMRPGRRRSFVERKVGGGKRFVKKVKQRFETFARSRPCFENW
ncbi:phosphatidyl inositol kinase [Thoreauomyces humboldtii]|nr:phosphatidyl inositol kinase [Thoreauomyces humboldtii]